MPKKPATRKGPRTTKPRSQSDSKPAATKARKPPRKTQGRSAGSLSHEQIAQRAYSLWEESGCQPGQADSHWYRAEHELRQQQG